LKLFTAKVNLAYDEVLPVLFANDSTWQWDDFNHTKDPVATTNVLSGQAQYTFTTDEQGNSVFSIARAYMKGPDGIFWPLDPVDPQTSIGADRFFEANPMNVGMPLRYDKFGPSVVLDPVPNYDSTGGLKVIFSRSPSYFVYTDTTKTPGVPLPGQRLLSLIPARDWLAVNKPESQTLAIVLKRIAEQKLELKSHMSKRDKDGRRRLQGARARSI
jgi:hypothetical protein